MVVGQVMVQPLLSDTVAWLHDRQLRLVCSQTPALLELVKPLLRAALGKGSVLEDSAAESGKPGAEEVVLNRQTALLSIKLLVRNLGQEHHDAFAKVGANSYLH